MVYRHLRHTCKLCSGCHKHKLPAPTAMFLQLSNISLQQTCLTDLWKLQKHACGLRGANHPLCVYFLFSSYQQDIVVHKNPGNGSSSSEYRTTARWHNAHSMHSDSHQMLFNWHQATVSTDQASGEQLRHRTKENRWKKLKYSVE